MNIKIWGNIALSIILISTLAVASEHEMVGKRYSGNILDLMHKTIEDYIHSEKQKTGLFNIYDHQENRLRRLQFMDLSDDVQIGEGYLFAEADFRDSKTGESLVLHFYAHHYRGAVSVDGVHIVSVDEKERDMTHQKGSRMEMKGSDTEMKGSDMEMKGKSTEMKGSDKEMKIKPVKMERILLEMRESPF